MNAEWTAGPTLFTPSDLRSSTWAKGFGRSVAELDPQVGEPLDAFGEIPPRPEKGAVVVTGGAGFLGVRVIRELLSRPGRDKVFVASRNPVSIGTALRNLVGPAEALRLLLDERLMMLPVDLAGEEAVKVLTVRTKHVPVRTVIHLAAAVDAFASREKLLPANETATRNAIAFAASVGARLVHASTLSVFVSSHMDGEDRETSLRGHPERMLLGGYAQGKAAAEMLVEDAAAMGLDACSVRLGLLVPERRGLMERGSFLTGFHDAILDVGAVPETSEEATVDLTPVDQAATALVAVADADAVPTFVHYANPQSATLTAIVRRLLGTEPRILADDEWDRRVDDLTSIRRTLLEAAFRKSRFLGARCASRPVANADLFQSTARSYDVSTAVSLGAPVPRTPERVTADLFGRR